MASTGSDSPDFAPSPPPDLPDVPSAEGPLPPWSKLVGRPYAQPADLLGEMYGPLFYGDFNGTRRLYACSSELVAELSDENRFAKNPTLPLAKIRLLAGDGLFTAYHGEPNWQKAHEALMPGFNYAGLRNHHSAMLDICGQLLTRWDACAGHGPVDASADLQKLAMDTVGLAGFGARFDSFNHDGLAPVPRSFTAAFSELGKAGIGTTTTEFDAEVTYLHDFFDDLVEQHRADAANPRDDLLDLLLGRNSDGIRTANRQSTPRTSAIRSGSAGVHRVSQADLAPNLVQQPPRAAQQRDPPAPLA